MKRIFQVAAILLTLVMLLGLVSCSRVPDDGAPDGMKIATAVGSDYRLYVPSVWTVNTAYGVSGAYFTMSEQSTVSVASYPITRQMTDEMQAAALEGSARLDWFWESTLIESVSRMAINGTVTRNDEESESVLLGECNARRHHVSAKVGDETLHFVHVLTERKSAFYVLSFTVTERLYESLLANLTSVIESFVFTEESYQPDSFVKKPTEGITAPEGMKLASNDEVAYRFFVPADWTLNQDEEIFAAYVESDRSSVSVVPYMPDAESMSVSEFFAMCEEMLKKTSDADGYKLLTTETEVDMGGRLATVYTYRFVLAGREYKCRQYIAAYKSMIYSITYTATPDCFDTHAAEVEKMVDEFEFR